MKPYVALILGGLVSLTLAGFLVSIWVGFAVLGAALLFTGFASIPRPTPKE